MRLRRSNQVRGTRARNLGRVLNRASEKQGEPIVWVPRPSQHGKLAGIFTDGAKFTEFFVRYGCNYTPTEKRVNRSKRAVIQWLVPSREHSAAGSSESSPSEQAP